MNTILQRSFLSFVLVVFILTSSFSQVYYEDVYYEDVYLEPVYYEDVLLESISYSGTIIEDVYYGGIDLRNYKISTYTITGKEKASDFFNDSVSSEYRTNWKKVIGKYAIGTTIIVITGVVAVASGGTVGYIAAGAFTGAAGSAVSGAAIGALIEGSLAALKGNTKEAVFKQAIEGSADGFMWGAITGAVFGGIKSANELKKGVPVLNSFGRINYVVDKNTGCVYLAKGGKPVGNVFNVTDKNGKYVFFIQDGKLYNFDGKIVSKSFKLNSVTGIISDTTTGNPVGYVDSLGYLNVGDDIQSAILKDWQNIKMSKHIEGGYSGIELGKVGNGKILRKNYQRYYNTTLPKGSQAHHIVPSNATGGGSAGDSCRKVFEKFGIDINDPHNCCPLPSDKEVSKIVGSMCHNGSTTELHGEKIMQSLYEDLSRANSKADVFEILADYRQAMLSNNPFWL